MLARIASSPLLPAQRSTSTPEAEMSTVHGWPMMPYVEKIESPSSYPHGTAPEDNREGARSSVLDADERPPIAMNWTLSAYSPARLSTTGNSR